MHELFEFRGQLDSIAQERIEAYKALEECAEAKRWYTSEVYLFSREEIMIKVVPNPQLKINFLDALSDKGHLGFLN